VKIEAMTKKEIFVTPINHVFLLYAPLNQWAAVINQAALEEIAQNFENGKSDNAEISELLGSLQSVKLDIPEIRTGSITDPFFLGIIPTRDCNMACRYCDFLNHDKTVMKTDIAKQSVDAYLNLLLVNGKEHGEIHFFGGEPFTTPEIIHYIVTYAEHQAQRKNIRLHFEVSTNGFCSDELAIWISNHFDSVVLSLDGSRKMHNDHRPQKMGKPSFERVYRSAKIFSEGDCDLIIRNCVSNNNVEQLPEIAKWYAAEFVLSSVCFEPLTPTDGSVKNELLSPEPITFARKFIKATSILESQGIHSVLSTADLSQIQGSSCPVGKDALIISPEGMINACYLLEKQWVEKNLDLKLGLVTKKGFQLNEEALNSVRAITVDNKSLCKNCFCRFHCAGGCHVNHDSNKPTGEYDDLCIRTRLVSAALLLNQLGMHDLLDEWLRNEKNMFETALQKSDRIFA
jgi:radical SAM protein with 4Fe4S-binding SPASM domain